MTDTFLLLTPLLLLPIVALLGFVGCDLVMGLVEVHAPPTAPQSLTATAGDMQVVLHWEGVTGATKYNIYRGTTSNGIYKADYPDHQSVDAPTTDLIDQPLMNGTTYYYIVTTESPYGESPPSEVRPATPTQAFSPSNIAGLTIWLDAAAENYANDEVVGTWTDRSGNGNDATQVNGPNKPTFKTGIFNGKPVYRFVIDKFLDFGNVLSALTSAEVFIVFATTESIFHAIWEMGPQSAKTYLPFDASSAFDGFGSTMQQVLGSYPPGIFSNANGVIYNVSAASGAWTARTNGSVYYATASNTVAWTIAPRLGNNSVGNQNPSSDIAELIIYNSVLSDADRSSVTRYLGTKYNITVA